MLNALSVAIVSYNATDVIIDCLESLVSAANADGIPPAQGMVRLSPEVAAKALLPRALARDRTARR